MRIMQAETGALQCEYVKHQKAVTGCGVYDYCMGGNIGYGGITL